MLLGAFFGGWEVILVLVVILLLLSAKGIPPLAKSLRHGIDEFRKASDEVTSEIRKAAQADNPETKQFSVRLFVAQGFGIGWIPFAPGTFGSLVGLGWFAILVGTGSFWAYLAGAIEGIAFSVWLCDAAEIQSFCPRRGWAISNVSLMKWCVHPTMLRAKLLQREAVGLGETNLHFR